MSEEQITKNKGGRPRREEGPKFPHVDVERLLVEGETTVGKDGAESRMWPSQRELAKRFNVSPSLIAAFASRQRCTERRKDFVAADSTTQTPRGNSPTTLTTKEEVELSALVPRRKVGRPRKADTPLISYEELDRLLVFGEVQLLEDGTSTTTYPTYRTLAARFGVAPSIIATYSKGRNCLRRREQAATRVAVRTEEKLIDMRADVLAVGETQLVQMIDDFLLAFEKALREGRVRADNPTDVNTLVRLKQFILGGADSRQEVRNILSLEALQERYARTMRELRDATPALSGIIESSAASEHPKFNLEENANNFSVAGGFNPRPQSPPTLDATRNLNARTMLLDDVRELLPLVRELASRSVDPESDDETLLEARVLRVAERLQTRLSLQDDAELHALPSLAPEGCQ